jgi:hypothetical protein
LQILATGKQSIAVADVCNSQKLFKILAEVYSSSSFLKQSTPVADAYSSQKLCNILAKVNGS